MSETYIRQWTMLRMIPRAPRKIDSRSILHRLEDEGFQVSKRSIERDLQTLSAVFPLKCDDRSKPFGWSWAGNNVFDIPSMDPPTALTFSLTAQFLKPLLPRSNLRYLQPHFRQASQVLANTGKSKIGKWIDKVRILSRGQKLLPAEVPDIILDTVYEALLANRRFQATYRPRAEEDVREYEINPLGLVFRDAVIYLICTLRDYDDIKQLVLHRIQTVQIMDKPCRKIKDFDIDQYIATGAFGYPVNEKNIKLNILFDAEVAIHLLETRLSTDQTIKQQSDGRILIEATVRDTQELRWWILGFGDKAEVIKPARLRNSLKQIANNMTTLYSRKT